MYIVPERSVLPRHVFGSSWAQLICFSGHCLLFTYRRRWWCKCNRKQLSSASSRCGVAFWCGASFWVLITFCFKSFLDVWCNILHLFFFSHSLFTDYLQHYSTHQTSACIRYRSSTIHLPARASFCRAITRLTRETLHYTPHFRFGCFRGPFANRICCIVNRCDRANSTNWAFPWKPPSAAWLAVLLRVTMATLVRCIRNELPPLTRCTAMGGSH